MREQGIDVSHYQGGPIWMWVRWRGHKAFAWAKATEGTTYADPSFSRSWTLLRRRGIKRGAYHFFRPRVSAIAQAHYFLAAVRRLGPILPTDRFAIDLEAADGMTPQAVVSEADMFARECYAQGVTPGRLYLYTAHWFWDGVLHTPAPPSNLLRCHLWLAQYGNVRPLPLRGWPTDEPKFWQYSDRGFCPGVRGLVDLDVFLGTVL